MGLTWHMVRAYKVLTSFILYLFTTSVNSLQLGGQGSDTVSMWRLDLCLRLMHINQVLKPNE